MLVCCGTDFEVWEVRMSQHNVKTHFLLFFVMDMTDVHHPL